MSVSINIQTDRRTDGQGLSAREEEKTDKVTDKYKLMIFNYKSLHLSVCPLVRIVKMI